MDGACGMGASGLGLENSWWRGCMKSLILHVVRQKSEATAWQGPRGVLSAPPPAVAMFIALSLITGKHKNLHGQDLVRCPESGKPLANSSIWRHRFTGLGFRLHSQTSRVRFFRFVFSSTNTETRLSAATLHSTSFGSTRVDCLVYFPARLVLHFGPRSKGSSRSYWADTHEGLVGRVETQFSNFGQGRLCPKFQ